MLSIDELDEDENSHSSRNLEKREHDQSLSIDQRELRSKRTHVDSLASSQAPPTIKTNKNSTQIKRRLINSHLSVVLFLSGSEINRHQ